MTARTAEELVAALGLAPHPEGGWYKETFRDRPADGGRGALTQIFYLLPAGEISAWHRVNDATEIWHHYAGAPLTLSLSMDGRTVVDHVMGPDVLAGQAPHVVVAPAAWQSARSLGDWTLCGCTVAPAFEFAGFEMAPSGWSPGG
ncbi:cupin domain-containing protein [Thalassobaculum sp.]|uniref:cupin domain-containing protein n=1 Tax=Thalassobaculum sp. TaxID=2022740 RepID=UPI0032ED0B9D